MGVVVVVVVVVVEAGPAGELVWLWLSVSGRVGRPPCEDVLGGPSRVNPGDEGACWRW